MRRWAADLDIKPVILAGGSGSRLWPLSRLDEPKQFLKLGGDNSLFQKAVLRSSQLSAGIMPIVVTSERHLWLSEAQLREIGVEAQVVVEPEPKNTAPAITLAALLSEETDCLVVIPSDHHIEEEDNLVKSLLAGAAIAASDECLVTFGVIPTSPHTEYGYISAGNSSDDGVSRIVEDFTEKPNEKVARQLLQRANTYWNAGIFACRAGFFLRQMRRFQKDVVRLCEQGLHNGSTKDHRIILSPNEFSLCPAVSIDYGLIEKIRAVRVVPIDVQWSDLGSWNSLWEHLPKDANGNSLQRQVLTAGTADSLVIGHGSKLTVISGLDDLVVIDSEDALFISKRQPNIHSRQVAESIEAKSPELLAHVLEVRRPWGGFRVLASGVGYKTKLLHVDAGQQISLQKHHHRDEKWTILRGRAEITLNDQVISLGVGESVEIPAQSAHRVRNPAKSTLEILEAQFGQYLGEDDIVRLSDAYGRV